MLTLGIVNLFADITYEGGAAFGKPVSFLAIGFSGRGQEARGSCFVARKRCRVAEVDVHDDDDDIELSSRLGIRPHIRHDHA